MFAYQKNGRFFAQAADGLESLAAAELAELGASEVKASYRGVYFSAEPAALYRINYMARIITRVLAPLITFDCHSDRYLYKTARNLRWSELLSLKTTFAVFANVSNSHIRHSQYAARRVKDAIADQFRDECGERPNVDPLNPDVWINLHIHENKATLGFDASGGSLHRRGYRKASVDAPMQETVAAAMVRMSGWNGKALLYDPMCGSGTLLAEALMQYCRIPAGYLRGRFGFEGLPDFDAALWENVRNDCDRNIRQAPPGLICGSDFLESAVAAARENCRTLPGGRGISILTRRFQDIDSLKDAVILCNPPHGQRLNTPGRTATLLEEFGGFLKERCPGATAYVYLGKESLIPSIPLWPSWKKPLNNGGMRGFLMKYKIR